MNKKLIIGAVALSATTLFGLTGCDESNPDTPKNSTYTVTFDHDDNPATAPQDVVEFKEGDTELVRFPEAPEMQGFAGVWQDFTLEDHNITVTAHYGNGTEENPYLVSTATQFGRMIKDYTSYIDTVYINDLGTEGEESEALRKRVNYKTMSLVYTRATVEDSWVFDRYETSNKTYFKLVSDIDISTISGLNSTDLSGRYFSGCIDGDGHNLIGFDGSLFTSTSGAMVENIVDTTFKNLNVYLGDNLASLVAHARGGNNYFENITTYNGNVKPTFVSADDNNESPFIFHAFGQETTLSFINCVNKADMVISADYCGLFLGGYAKNIAKLSFNGCVNEASIRTSGGVGLLIGNGTYSPADLEVDAGCKNLGSVESKKDSHILISHITGSGMLSEKVKDYDNADRLKNAAGEVVGTLGVLQSQYLATVDGDNITITNKTEGENISYGNYQLILSAYASNKSGENHMSLLTNIVIGVNVEEGESYTFENVYYGMMDLNTYNKSSLSNKVDASQLEDTEWTNLKGYNIKYFVDAENGIYVIDFSQHEDEANLGENKLVINTTKDKLNKVVVVYNEETKDIEFIADFN